MRGKHERERAIFLWGSKAEPNFNYEGREVREGEIDRLELG